MQRKCHFIGIGGIGMSGLARILLSKKESVSGSDVVVNYVTEGLQKAGAKVFTGHCPENISPDMTVIYTTDINKDNPEFQAALSLKCPLLHRSDLLLQLMSGYRTLAVAGTHGKTTTSALLATVLVESSLDPSFAIGGILPQFHSNAGYGHGEYFVAEADESDGTFLKYNPWGAIVTNLDSDHMDYYKTQEALETAFKTYMNKIQIKEALFWCGDEIRLAALAPQGISYGFGHQNQLVVSKFRQEGWRIFFNLDFRGNSYENIEVALTGKHNALNASAVFGLALTIGAPEKAIRAALRNFKGIMRRCEHKSEIHKILIVDDYAHHPTEIKATLKAVREAVQEKRLVAVFQPHRYSRTRDCLGTYGNCFKGADEVIVTDIYGAGEAPITGISAVQILYEIKSNSTISCRYVPRNELAAVLSEILRPHDVMIALGAGDITKLCAELYAQLSQRAPRKYTVGVIYGGRSVEHDVSLLSAKNICEALNPEIYDLIHFGITKQGIWKTGTQMMQQIETEKSTILSEQILNLLNQCDLLFPVLHGRFGEDGTIQGFFDILGKPYVGCDHRSAAIAMDKALTKKIMLLNGVSVVPYVDFSSAEWNRFPELLLDQIKNQLNFPVFIKPVHLGSSIGVTKIEAFKGIEASIEKVFQKDNHLLVENGVIGREIEFAVLGNQWVKVFPPGEICTEGKMYDFEGKYGQNAMKTNPKVDLPSRLIEEGMFLAETAYNAIGCTGMARVDFFLDQNNKFWLNEVNPIPGFTCNSLYPGICKANGLEYADLIDRLVILALERSRQLLNLEK